VRPFLVAFFLVACGDAGPQHYGAPAPGLEAAAVDLDQALLAKKEQVVVRGEIGQVCEQGCWFYLLGANGLVYVKLDLGRGLVIPVNSKGKRAVVAGRLQGENAERKLVGESILIY